VYVLDSDYSLRLLIPVDEIFLYLQEVAANHEANMMTAANLAIVMAPNLLKPLPDASAMTILSMLCFPLR
jgi:hypothetical protein